MATRTVQRAAPLWFPPEPEMRKQVRLRTELIEAARGLRAPAEREFDRVLAAAERRLVNGYKRGEPIRDLFNLNRNIATARALGEAGTPDPLLDSLRASVGMKVRTVREQATRR